jgi:RNA polymerase sigma-32 factor
MATDREDLDRYLKSARRFSLLERDEEHALATRFRDTGDPIAFDRLVGAHLRLVAKIALEHRRRGVSLLDLVQEGNVGLVHAVRKFDPDRGVRLATYAAFWIRAFILRWLMTSTRLVRVATTQEQRKLFWQLRKAQARLEQEGVAPDPEVIAAQLHTSEAGVLEMDQRLAAVEESIDAPHARHESELYDDAGDRPDRHAEEDELEAIVRERARSFVATLGERDREIFDARFLSDEPTSLSDLARRYGVSRERARQIEARLVARFRAFAGAELGVDSAQAAA